MTGSVDDAINELERKLESVERDLATLGSLSDQQARRVAARMDRLASQLLEVSSPPAMDAVHARLGTSPATDEDFAAVMDGMRPPDHEG